MATTIPLLLTVALATIGAAAAPSHATVHVGSRVYSTRDGLPAGKVQAIAQDKQGYLWIGMSSGLVRFDGFAFEPWGVHGEPHLLSQDIRALLVDHEGTLWVGYCSGGGVTRIEGQTVTHFTARDGLVCVRSLAEDDDGTVWAGTRGGLARLQGKRWKFVQPDEGLPLAVPRALATDGQGGLWVGTSTGLFHRPKGSRDFLHISRTPIANLAKDRAGAVWRLYAAPRWTVERIEVVGSVPKRMPIEGSVGSALIHDRGGTLWISKTRAGVLRIEQDGARQHLTGSYVLVLFEDRDGDIWAGTTDGLVRFFKSNVHMVRPFASGTGDAVLNVAATPDGTVWLGTTAGLYSIGDDGKKGLSTKTVWPGQSISVLYTDFTGQLWIGTSRGLSFLRQGRITPLADSGSASGFAIAKDAQGNFWSCRGDEPTVYVWRNGRGSAHVPFEHMRHRACVAVYADRRANVWMGFADGTLARHDATGGDVFFAEGATPSAVCAIHEDPDGTLWFATTQGLRRFRDGAIRVVSEANGLPSAFLTGMVADEDGYFWLVFTSGVIRLARHEIERAVRDPGYRVRYAHYDISDHLPVPAMCMNRPTAARRADGTLWFVTETGVAMIDPRHFVEAGPIPAVHVERVLADGNRIQPVDHLELPPTTSRLRIDYSAPSVANASKLQFQFKLEGVDHQWIHAGSARYAEYTNLSAGSYRFSVAASLNGIRQSETQWRFSVRPFFYGTWWFYGICFAVAAAVMGWTWQWRVRALQRRFAVVLDERSRIARELHDTILQSMAGIVLKLEGLAMDAAETTASRLRHILREIEYHIEEARDSIWNLRWAPLESRTLPTALHESAIRITEDSSATCELRVRGDVRRYPRETEEELLRIAEEAVRNAVRHGTAAHISIDLVYEPDKLRLRVIDDGCGFDPASSGSQSTLHWGLRGITERASRIGGQVRMSSAVGKGTDIETVVPFRS